MLPPHPVRREAPAPPTLEPVPAAHRRWVVPLVGAVGLAVILVLALTLVGLGPFASGPDVPGAQLDVGRYPGDPTELAIADVATGTTASGEDAESATAIVDGDPATAWRSGASTTTDAEVIDTIELGLARPSWVTRIELRNGDHLDREAYDRSARLREVRLRFDGGVVVDADLLDIGLRAQAVTLPEPVLTTVIRIDVLRAVELPNDQLALSGLELFGWPAIDGDVELAEERSRAEPATGPAARGLPRGLGRTSTDQSS